MSTEFSFSIYLSLSLSLSFSENDFSSFLPVLIARGKCRGATRAHLASLGARADAVSHIRMLLFLVTPAAANLGQRLTLQHWRG